jgi:ATP-dependent DNA helicase Rep
MTKRARVAAAVRHVLVDEYQDTNAVQYELLKALVGDEGGMLHRGGRRRPEHLRLARRHHRQPEAPAAGLPALKVIALEQNYRSTGHILRAANAVIAHNPKLFEKKLWSEFGDGEPVRVLECDGEEHEAERAVAFIQALRGQQGGAA